VGAVVLVAAATIEYLQHDKARQLEGQEIALKHEQANILAELSGTKLLRGEIASALRLASQGTRIDMTLPSNAMKGSQSVAVSLKFARSPGSPEPRSTKQSIQGR
jgi:hypothetical protein